MLKVKAANTASTLDARLLQKAKALGEAHAKALRTAANDRNLAWYDARLLWPLLGRR